MSEGELVQAVDDGNFSSTLVIVEKTKEVGWIPSVYIEKSFPEDKNKAPTTVKEALGQRE